MVGTDPSPQSNLRYFTTAAGGSPEVLARPTGTKTGEAQVTGPPGVWTAYEITVCPVGITKCQTFSCPKAAADPTICPIAGLDPDTTYVVTAVALGTGAPSPKSNEAQLTTNQEDT